MILGLGLTNYLVDVGIPDAAITWAQNSSATFGKPVRYIAVAVLPGLLAVFLGTLAIAWLPILLTGLPGLLWAVRR